MHVIEAGGLDVISNITFMVRFKSGVCIDFEAPDFDTSEGSGATFLPNYGLLMMRNRLIFTLSTHLMAT
ncbi:hypothetical protein L596_022220 [Steinernema carpocapsae]|uniref:Uncharacterized protein n=1 Tax=Steinernema carpocapsae TaxID=34508 RepID=A0A4U5MLG7_STECR|nr:hypothetical protein L596_022220 [Steinernema carpocapsae]